MKSKLLIAIAGVTLLGVAQASAEIVTFTYTGTMSDGYDGYNTWATGNTDLTGDPFRLVFTANTAIGYRYTVNNSPYYVVDEVYGGSGYGNQSPVTAVLTINGQSETLPSSAVGSAFNQQLYPAYYGYTQSGNEEVVEGDGNSAYAYAYDPTSSSTFPFLLTTPFNVAVGGNVQGGGFFALYSSDPIATYGIFSINNVSSVVSATPLPSTWTMLIAGFAGLGFFAYRGTKKDSVAIAAA
jgi:hypothetical protein